MNFNQAIKWLREGKKVRRPSWDEDSYWELGIDEVIRWTKGPFTHVHLNQIEAKDWEIFKEEKIKTLKDIEADYRKRFEEKGCHQPGGGLSDDTQRYWFRNGYKVSFKYFSEEVKVEAIKHIKELESRIKKHPRVLLENLQNEGCRAKIAWIKHFFNITEEEIKND